LSARIARRRGAPAPAIRRSPPLSAGSLLELMWLASPALPVGGFSYSEGFEAAVETGAVANEPDATAWLLDQLQLVVARSELPVIAKAWAAWRRDDFVEIAGLNSWVLSSRESSEALQQTEQMGRSLARWLGQRDASGPQIAALAALAPSPTWPVAFALAAVRSGAPRRESMLAFAFGWAENIVQAAVRSMPLGQSAGQRILAALAREIPAAVDHATRLRDSQRQAYAPMLAILSSQHETQYSRLFRS
jgi:urease accessory protein